MSESVRITMTKLNKKIVMTVLPDGEIRIETIGFSGKACMEESRWLKDALGKEVSKQLTPAYFAVAGKETVKKMLPLCG
jgi:hypothetical protein